MAKSYGQYCGLARSLDVVGGRWTLLIVRELLAGPARYNELLSGLPGIATNLLASRLRELEEVGILQRTIDTDSNGIAYKLTPWGTELRPVVAALCKWSVPLMISGTQGDQFRTHWLVVALDALLGDQCAEDPTEVGVSVDDSVVTVRVDGDGTHVQLAGEEQPQTVLRGDPAVVLGLASGMLTIEQAVSLGVLRGSKAELALAFGRD